MIPVYSTDVFAFVSIGGTRAGLANDSGGVLIPILDTNATGVFAFVSIGGTRAGRTID